MLTGRTARQVRVAAWLVATALIAGLAWTLDPARALWAVERVAPWWLVAAVASNLLIQPLGALQWWSLLPPGVVVPVRRMMRLFSLTSVANNTTPSLIGHATGAVLLANEPGVGKANALSVVALDQIAVGVAKVAVIGLAASLLALPPWMERGLAGLGGLVAALIVAAAAIAARTRHLPALRRPWRAARGVGFALAVKAAEAGAILAVQRAFGLDAGPRTVIVVLAASALGSVVPIAPANIGTYEAAAYAAYRFLGVDADTALGIAVIQHLCQLLPAVGAGYVLLSLPRFRRRVPPPQRCPDDASIHEDGFHLEERRPAAVGRSADAR